ncbi:MAG: SMC-Scp complex subunit ScpB [Candidatus Paceibacterota bacterium]
MKLEQTIEALLFATGNTYSVSELSLLLSKDKDEIEEALQDLELSLRNRGIKLIRSGDEVLLASAKEISPIIQALRKSELTSPLSQAALDTLSIVLYASPVEKRHIDMLRGVDSRAMLRTLKIRDLVNEQRTGEGERGKLVYNPTTELLRFMGIEKPEALPDYPTQREVLLRFIESEENPE